MGTSPEHFFTVVDEFFARLGRSPQVIYAPLEAPTLGAAETALHGLQRLHESRMGHPSVLLDGDTFYSADILTKYRQYILSQDFSRSSLAEIRSTGGLVFVFKDDRPLEVPYSYVKVKDEDGKFLKLHAIQEKDKSGMSPLACSGCYCFNSSSELLRTISSSIIEFGQTNMVDGNAASKELFTSTIISRAISDGGHFDAVVLGRQDFTVLGTPSQLLEFVKTQPVTPRRFCFDLDNTLVSAPTEAGNYATCKPIEHMIRYVQELHAQGHHIIIHTARRMRTHAGNIGSVISDIGALTMKQLKDYCIPHDELIFGKPYADHYIDDKAILALVGNVAIETGMYTASTF